MTTDFVPNPQGFRALEQDTREAEDAWAESIATRAREIAPVRTGAYRDSIHAVRSGEDAAVAADAEYALFVEFGTADTPAFAPLTTAAQTSARDLQRIFDEATS